MHRIMCPLTTSKRYPFAITLCVYCWRLYGQYSYFLDNDCILDIVGSDQSTLSLLDESSLAITTTDPTVAADALMDRIDEISVYYHRLSVYYTIILALMLPSIVLLYVVIMAIARCLSWCIKRAVAPIQSVAGRVGTRSSANSQYSEKQERFNLVERSVADCPICIRSDIELVLTKGCRHGCCRECLRKYIETDLKNIASYPRRCFMNDCHTLLNYTNVEYVMTGHELEEYDRMLIKSSTSGSNEVCHCVWTR